MPAASRLTILSVAYPFAPVSADSVGGAEQVLWQIDQALVAAGHHSIVIACHGSTTAGELIAVPVPDGEIDEAKRQIIYEVVRAIIAEAMQRRTVDLIHLHGVDFHAYLPPPGPPCLITLHLPPASYAPGALEVTRRGTWLHCVSPSQQRAYARVRSILPPIPNGVPVEALSAHRHAPRSFALMLGRICPEKGQHFALQAAHRADVALLLAGSVFAYAAHRDYYARCVAPQLDRQRRWLGAVGFQRKRRLLSAARCLLAPSLIEETASLVAMEAMACGTPVIAYPAGALRELVQPGITGFLVRNVPEMADAIHRAGDIDPEVCRQIARERFSLRHMTDAYLARFVALAGTGAVGE